MISCAVEKGDLINNDDQNDSRIMLSVSDIGCDTGILGNTFCLPGATIHAILLDCDDGALELSHKNVKQIENDYCKEYDTSERCIMYKIPKTHVQFSPL